MNLHLSLPMELHQDPAKSRAMALTAHNALLRGGEIGKHPGPNGPVFDPKKCLTLRSVSWCAPCRGSGGHKWLILWVTPIKDQTAGQIYSQPVPTPIVRRQEHGKDNPLYMGTDRMCVYDAIRRVWERKAGQPIPEASADWNQWTHWGGANA